MIHQTGEQLTALFTSPAGAITAILTLAVTVVGLLVFGCGISFTLPALVAGVASIVPVEFAGIGAGALNCARQVGALLGVAVLGVVLTLTERSMWSRSCLLASLPSGISCAVLMSFCRLSCSREGLVLVPRKAPRKAVIGVTTAAISPQDIRIS